MMNHYNYRWLYGIILFVLSLLAGFYWFIQPEQQSLHAAENKVLRLKQTIARTRSSAPSKQINDSFYPYHYADALTMLFLAAHTSHAIIQSLRLQGESVQQDYVSLVANGSFSQLTNFISLLQRQPILMVVTDFSWHLLGAENLQFSAVIWLIKHGRSRQFLFKEAAALGQSAFCTGNKIGSQTNGIIAAQSVPFAWMRMVGYLQQRHRLEAWIKLPSNELISVKKNDQIGKEGGIVTEITPAQTVLRTHAGRKVIRSE